MAGCVAVDGVDGGRVGFGRVVDGAADAFGCEEDGFGAESLEYQFRCLLQQNFLHFVLVVPVLDIDGVMEKFETFLFDGESVKLIADIPNKDLALVSEGV